MQHFLTKLIEEHRQTTRYGKVADYIPELAGAEQSILGITIIDSENNVYSAGDSNYKFTLQSITKVITLMIALMERGKKEVFSHVGMEPTGDPFNSIVRLETERPSKPLNPMINAGAIATVALIDGNNEERTNKIINLIRKMAGNDSITFNEKVYQSEKETGDLNRAMTYFMKNYGVIKGDIEEHLDVYFKQSSIEVTTVDVARIGNVIAQGGKDIVTNEQIIPSDIIRIAKTFMVTCGMYNASGEFAINVGFPAKSGVGGGILALVPNQYGIGVVGPSLDNKGNSIGGIKILEEFSKKYSLSIF